LQVNKKYININNSSRDSHSAVFQGTGITRLMSNVRLQRVMETNIESVDLTKLNLDAQLISSAHKHRHL